LIMKHIGETSASTAPVYKLENRQFDLVKSFRQHIKNEDGFALIDMSNDLDTDTWIDLYNSGEKNEIVKIKDAVRTLTDEAYRLIKDTHTQLRLCMKESRPFGAEQLLCEETGIPWRFIEPLASDNLKSWVSDELDIKL